jgi:hypothetical protein
MEVKNIIKLIIRLALAIKIIQSAIKKLPLKALVEIMII